MEISSIERSILDGDCGKELKKPSRSQCSGCKSWCHRFVPSLNELRQLFTKVFSFALLYATIWGSMGVGALPGSILFALLLLMVMCYVGGKITQAMRLPGLCGMLICGFMYRNLSFIPFFKDIPFHWAASLRNGAFVVVLLRAGLGLDPAVLKRVSFICVRLAFMPCFIEASTLAVAVYYFMHMPWAWSFCLGFVMAAVSPAVVVPSMLLLQEKGLGVNKGIPTLILASSSFDDVLAIMGFGVALGIAFSNDSGGGIVWTICKGPLEVIVGIAYGAVIGVLSWHFPSANDERKVFYRVIILTLGGLAVSFISNVFGLGATGALGCLSLSFVAAMKWREEKDKNMPVADVEAGLWMILELFLFGLIGAEVSMSDLKDNIGFSALVLSIGLAFRTIATYCSLMFSDLNTKEKLFVCFAWLPKATVQAAIGPVALDLAIRGSNPVFIEYGRKILTTSVLSIIITAPLGALAIALLAPILLHRTTYAISSPNEIEPVNKNTDASSVCLDFHKNTKSSSI